MNVSPWNKINLQCLNFQKITLSKFGNCLNLLELIDWLIMFYAVSAIFHHITAAKFVWHNCVCVWGGGGGVKMIFFAKYRCRQIGTKRNRDEYCTVHCITCRTGEPRNLNSVFVTFICDVETAVFRKGRFRTFFQFHPKNCVAVHYKKSNIVQSLKQMEIPKFKKYSTQFFFKSETEIAGLQFKLYAKYGFLSL